MYFLLPIEMFVRWLSLVYTSRGYGTRFHLIQSAIFVASSDSFFCSSLSRSPVLRWVYPNSEAILAHFAHSHRCTLGVDVAK